MLVRTEAMAFMLLLPKNDRNILVYKFDRKIDDKIKPQRKAKGIRSRSFACTCSNSPKLSPNRINTANLAYVRQ